MRVASGLTVIGVWALLAACGQKGPLVMPDAEHPRKKIGLPTAKPPTPQTPPQTAPPIPQQ